MGQWRARDAWVGALAVASAVLAVATTAVFRLAFDEFAPPSLLLLAALVVIGAAATLRRPRSAARRAWLFVVPASQATWLWTATGTTAPFTYAVVGTGEVPPDVAYLATGTPAVALPTASVPLSLAALVLLLWVLTTLGLVALVRDARPGSGAAHVLAVVASLLTVPLWLDPVTRHLQLGVLDLVAASPSGSVVAVRTTACALVGIGVLVVRSHRRVPARSSLYVLPGVLLTWLAWHAGVGPAPAYGFATSNGALPTWVDTLPWGLTPACTVALIAIVWIQALRGLRAVLTRYRPPTALEEPLAP